MIIFSRVRNKASLDKSLELRKKVFVVEQRVPEDRELDEYDNPERLDKDVFHFNVFKDDICISTARIVKEKELKIQRVCVDKNYRGLGIGLYIMKELHKFIEDSGIKQATLSSQEHSIEFYKKLGYVEIGNPYLDAGILHKKMYLNFPF